MNLLQLLVPIVIIVAGIICFKVYRSVRYKAHLSQYDREPILYHTPEFKRDAKLISYAVFQYATRNTKSFWKRIRDDEPPEQVVDSVQVVDILYDSTKLKLVSLVGICDMIPSSKNREHRKTCDGIAVAGIREAINQPWKIWRLEQITVADYDTVLELAPRIRLAYFERIGHMSMYAGPDWEQSYHAPLENIDSPTFWESALWRKDVRQPGLYPFQVRQGIKNRDSIWIPVKPFVEEYPDWITEMYTAE